MSKTKTTTVNVTCDICGEECGNEESKIIGYRLLRNVTGYRPVEAIGVDICAIPFGPMTEDVCRICAEESLLQASTKLPEWQYLLRYKAIAKDLLAWYDDGQRTMQQLDRIRDAAADLLPR